MRYNTTYSNAHPWVHPMLQIALSPFCGENVDGGTSHLQHTFSTCTLHVQEGHGAERNPWIREAADL